jgi:3-mercaptopyruvate sulfurtransferase SseA
MTRRAMTLVATLVVMLPMLLTARQGDESTVARMSLPEFKKALESGLVLAIDVRDAQSYALGHIPGAISVPLGNEAKKAVELKASKKALVTYCA